MKRNISKSLLMTALITGLCIGGVQGVSAAENLDTFALDEYVVTATRTLKQLQEVPASVSVVTAQDIEEKNIMSVPDALQMVTGVYKSQAAQGGIQMRGFTSEEILVLIDGMQLNTAYGNAVEWEMIPVENVERIEVVKGAGSSLYGGRAVGGVINIITKDNNKEKGVKVNAVLNYGSNSTWKKALYADVKANEKISFGVGYENSKSDGIVGYQYTTSRTSKSSDGKVKSDNDIPRLDNGKYLLGDRGEKEYENENITANVKYNFDDSKSLKYTFRHSESESRYSNPSTTVVMNGKPTFFEGKLDVGGKYHVKSSIDSYLGYENRKEYDMHTLSYNDDENKVAVNLGYLDVDKNGYSQPNGADSIDYEGAGNSSYHPGETYNIDFQKAWEDIGKHNILVGGTYKQESFDQVWTMLSKWRDDDSIDYTYGKNGIGEEHGGKARNIALYVQDEYKMSEPVTMYMGLRYDYWKKFDGYTRFYEGSVDAEDYEAKSYTELSPKLAFDIKADDKTNYYISYGHSFNPPQLYQVYRNGGNNAGSVIANSDLDPETSDTFEIGMKKKLSEKTNLAISVYHVETEDKVIYFYHYTPGTTDTEYKQYDNWGTEKRYGVEFEIEHKFDDHLGSYFNYAYQRGQVEYEGRANTNNKDAVDEADYGIPRHLLHAGVKYNNDKLNALLECQYVSERQAPDDTTGEYGSEDAYFIVNTALNYKLSKGLTLQFGVDNLFDKEFYASEATSGRTYYTGLRYSF